MLVTLRVLRVLRVKIPQIPKILKKLTSPQKYIFTEIINFNLRGKKKKERDLEISHSV